MKRRLVACLLVILGLSFIWLAYLAMAVAATAGALTSAGGVSGIDNLRVVQKFDYGSPLINRTSHTVIVHPVSVVSIPPHVRLTHEMILPGGGFIALRGWPPGGRPPFSYPTTPPDGFRLNPHHTAFVGLAFVADRPGVYTAGPLVAHVDVPGALGLTFGDAQHMPAYGVMCVAVSRSRCHAAEGASIPGS